MTNVADAAPVPGQVQPPARTSIRGLLAQTEIDLRLFGMLVALGAILLTFNILSGGKFFQPTNMITLAVQAAGVAIIATGMVLVIVSRNIDLSVGSLVGLIAMSYALLMTDIMPNVLGIGADFPFRWLIALVLGVALGATVGALQGFIIAYIGVPSFIVTLGGLLSIRGAVWYLSNGAAVSGLDPNFQLIGGGAQGSIGGTLTWVLGLVGVVAIIALLINGRRQRRRYGFPRPTDVGRGPDRRRRLRGRARPGRVRQREPVAGGPRESDRPRAELGAGTRRRLEDPDGFPVPDHPAPRRDARDDLHRRPGDGSGATSTRTAATPTRPSWPASTPAGRSSRPTS